MIKTCNVTLILLLLLWDTDMIVRALRQYIKSGYRHNVITRQLSTATDEPQTITSASKDAHFMKLAIRHAQFAYREKEVPIGAVIVNSNGEVIAASRNKVESNNDASQHAEMDVLRKAATFTGNWRLLGCTLYTTLEPCPMCLGAIQSFRIDRLVFAAKDPRLGACGSWVDLVHKNVHPFHQISVTEGVLADEASSLLRNFFRWRRRSKNAVTDIDRGNFYLINNEDEVVPN